MIFAAVNSKYIRIGAAVAYAVMVLLLIFFIYDVPWWKAMCFALLTSLVQGVSFKLFRFRTDFSFACSFLPAMFCVLHICYGKIWTLAASVVSLVILALVFSKERYDTRDTTRFWVGLALYMVMMALTAALLV